MHCIPIATFGAKLWILDDKGLLHLKSFQVFVGRRIQRLFLKSPNASAYFSLGWVHLEMYVEIKKLLFLHSVLSHDVEDTTQTVIIQRAKKYFDNIEICSMNQQRSTVYDLINTAYTFGFDNEVRNIIYRGQVWSRAHWRGIIWNRAWETRGRLLMC